ncbi:helix-turn-helix domain-containing protein [Chromohalobacter canadensis]|uniref:Helix-turn-helix transcriptional regulator n=1 Tax=Chromohalobacter canadensis TaxID=141389 RepID=A0ABZ0Y8J7_9GAMM|nr:helix-turn-helix transcriptional regulator [Chromohalobacter canadensis]MCK0770308.1 helix-turn-helix domain-containing protein [Chromohalobacter canadensis]WQH07772.1 helix-turn-helix transcriptional regulator [Chromohalobacter canadensis]
MDVRQAFGTALQRCRKRRGLSQEQFSEVSSRTYLSSLERGLKSPTLAKVDELASVLGVHPLTLLAECYRLRDDQDDVEALLERVRSELLNQPVQ